MLFNLYSLSILEIVGVLAGLVAAITIHEFAHAWTADRLGDPTPRIQDRVTLDPRAHLDPLGSIALLIAGFGWGRPVEFDPHNLKEPLRDTAIIALAGPASNIALATAIAIPLNLGLIPGFLAAMAYITIGFNVVLALFNLIPVAPLDGSKIMMAVLPPDTAYEYETFMDRFGIWLLLLMIVRFDGTSIASRLISPGIDFLMKLFVPGI